MYNLGRGTNASFVPKSSEESVTGAFLVLKPIVKNETYSDTYLSMAADSHASSEVPKMVYSMVFK